MAAVGLHVGDVEQRARASRLCREGGLIKGQLDDARWRLAAVAPHADSHACPQLSLLRVEEEEAANGILKELFKAPLSAPLYCSPSAQADS